MLRIPFRQRRRALGGQGIHAGAMVNPVAGHIGVVPRALAHRRHARHDARRHFRRQPDFAALVEHPHQIAVINPAFFCVKRVDPHFLTAGGLKHIHVAVAGMGARLIVESKQLQRILTAQRIVPAFKCGGVDRQRADDVVFLQLPAGGNLWSRSQFCRTGC